MFTRGGFIARLSCDHHRRSCCRGIKPGSEPSAADYFAGKPIRSSSSPATQQAVTRSTAQLAAQHLGRFIPGNPSVVISYLPGAAGLQCA